MQSSSLSPEPSFKRQPHDSPVELFAGRLAVFPNDGEVFVSGSCFRIAKNLYTTARHVLTDYADRYGCGNNHIDAECWVIHILPGPQYAIYVVDYAWMSLRSDLAVFHTRPYNDIATAIKVTHSVGLELAPPALHDRVVGFGYHDSSGNVDLDANGTRHIKVNAFGAATVGHVQEIFHARRDSSRLNFPCYQVNARFDGGMSGGPLISDRGSVCGIICSSIPPHTDGEQHISYAATLWPLMGIQIDIDLQGNPCEKHYPLLELARQGVIRAAGWDRIQLDKIPGSDQCTIQFRP